MKANENTMKTFHNAMKAYEKIKFNVLDCADYWTFSCLHLSLQVL